MAAKAAGLELTGAELQRLPQLERCGHLGQRLAAHHPRPQPAQIPLARLREGRVEVMRHHEVEDRIAEKLQPLVVGARAAAMREGGAEEAGVPRLVAELARSQRERPVGALSHPPA